MSNFIDYIIYLASAVIAVIFVFAPHEYAHAYVAYKCGDPTAKMNGRMTLNPVRHFDPFGFALCVFAGFGWARPVPVNPSNFRNFRRGLFLVAIAGVVANFIVAFIACPMFMLIDRFFPGGWHANFGSMFLYRVFATIYTFSLSVFVFNLLPLSPLDGYRVVEALTRSINPVRRFLRNYGYYILVALVLESFLCDIILDYTNLSIIRYFNILGYVQWFAVNIIGYPIMAFWNLVFGYPMPRILSYF